MELQHVEARYSIENIEEEKDKVEEVEQGSSTKKSPTKMSSDTGITFLAQKLYLDLQRSRESSLSAIQSADEKSNIVLPLNSDNNLGHTQARVFTKFPELANELQHKIWLAHLQQQRRVRVSRKNISQPHQNNRYVTFHPIPTLLHVNQQSRFLALKFYGRFFKDAKQYRYKDRPYNESRSQFVDRVYSLGPEPELVGKIDTRQSDGIFLNPDFDTVLLYNQAKVPARELCELRFFCAATVTPNKPWLLQFSSRHALTVLFYPSPQSDSRDISITNQRRLEILVQQLQDLEEERDIWDIPMMTICCGITGQVLACQNKNEEYQRTGMRYQIVNPYSDTGFIDYATHIQDRDTLHSRLLNINFRTL